MAKLDIQLDFRSGNPIYIQIMHQIQHAIAAGDLAAEDQLPTVRQLAAELRVNFNTIARAYRMLDDAGIISTQHGRGTFILAPPSKEAGDRQRKEDLDRLTQQYLKDTSDLGFSQETIQDVFQKKINEWFKDGQNPSAE